MAFEKSRAEKKFWTVKDIAQYLALSPRTVARLINSDQLRHHKFGHSLRVSPEDFEAFIALRRQANTHV